ncbi:transposase, MuDR, MULE transposase domain protein [Tanacetum coccineum]
MMWEGMVVVYMGLHGGWHFTAANDNSLRSSIIYYPVLMIDAATFKKGSIQGNKSGAVAMDEKQSECANCIWFKLCKGDKQVHDGSWWMSVLKECIGDNPNLLFISDRHAAIAMAVENEFPLAFHVVCCRHLMRNLSLKNKK